MEAKHDQLSFSAVLPRGSPDGCTSWLPKLESSITLSNNSLTVPNNTKVTETVAKGL
jgi:hypothetical protein